MPDTVKEEIIDSVREGINNYIDSILYRIERAPKQKRTKFDEVFATLQQSLLDPINIPKAVNYIGIIGNLINEAPKKTRSNLEKLHSGLMREMSRLTKLNK